MARTMKCALGPIAFTAVLCVGCDTGSILNQNGNASGSGGSGSNGSCQILSFTPMQQPPPNMLLVMDKSGSMKENTPSGIPKWNAMRTAIGQLVMTFQQVRFGLMLFPANADCGPGTVGVPVA